MVCPTLGDQLLEIKELRLADAELVHLRRIRLQLGRHSYVGDQDIAESLGSESFTRPTDPSDPRG
jgi:hypothetical protein